MKKQKWFMDRIGKKIYLNTDCDCIYCKDEINGVIIKDECMAITLYNRHKEYNFKYEDKLLKS
jgi:hypothetical protein